MTLNPDNDPDPPGRDRDDTGPLPDPELDGPDPADAEWGCPPELAGIPVRELAAEAEAWAAARGPAAPELMEAGFRRHPRAARALLAGNPVQRPGFAQGGVLDTMAPGPGLAGFADEASKGTRRTWPARRQRRARPGRRPRRHPGAAGLDGDPDHPAAQPARPRRRPRRGRRVRPRRDHLRSKMR